MPDRLTQFKKRTMKYIILGITFGISLSFISWIVGMILNTILAKTQFYSTLSNLNYIPSETINKQIGIGYFKWIVKNTFFKFFNQKIKVANKKTDFIELRKEMTNAEISHLIAFIFVLLLVLYCSFTVSYVFGTMILIVNLLMNLYPALLQQENKRRIDKLINRQAKIGATNALA